MIDEEKADVEQVTMIGQEQMTMIDEEQVTMTDEEQVSMTDEEQVCVVRDDEGQQETDCVVLQQVEVKEVCNQETQHFCGIFDMCI